MSEKRKPYYWERATPEERAEIEADVRKLAVADAERRNGHTSPSAKPKRETATAPPEWDTPMPLEDRTPPPPFPVAHLPAWAALFVTAEAKATQTPPDLAAMLLIAQLGAALSHKIRIAVREGWSEPTNLFTVTALFSGERKSAVYRDVMAPTYQFEAEFRAEMAPIIAAAKAEHAVLDSREKHLVSKAAKTEDKLERDCLLHDAKEAARELAKHQIPEEPQLICDDVTPENLAKLLVRQSGKILLAGAEGTAFEIAKGRYSEGANFDVWLKGHAGDPIRTNRISREREAIDNPALSAALAVQPDVIHGLASEASMRTRGFLARWLFSVPESKVGLREIAPAPMPQHVTDAHRRNVIACWRIAGTVDDDGRPAPNWVAFSGDADEALREFERWLEPLLAPGEELSLLAGWANKLAGTVARIAGILHVADAIGEGKPWQSAIDVQIVESSIALARQYLIPHAKIAFALMGADEKIEKARHVWENVIRHSAHSAHSADAPPILSRRDLHNQNRRQFVSAKDLDPIIEVLSERGYLFRIPDAGERGRGHPSPRFWVNLIALRGGAE